MLKDRGANVSGKIPQEQPLCGAGTGHRPALRRPGLRAVTARLRDMADPAVALALGFGLGLAPWMPGTFGALGAFLLYLPVMQLPAALQCAVALALLALGCAVCGRAARLLGGEDPSAIVWDETVGMLVTLVLTPATPLSWLVGFLAFRALDINKPGLIGTAERRLRGGAAIMADDALAGLAAAAIVWPAVALQQLVTG